MNYKLKWIDETVSKKLNRLRIKGSKTTQCRLFKPLVFLLDSRSFYFFFQLTAYSPDEITNFKRSVRDGANSSPAGFNRLGDMPQPVYFVRSRFLNCVYSFCSCNTRVQNCSRFEWLLVMPKIMIIPVIFCVKQCF